MSSESVLPDRMLVYTAIVSVLTLIYLLYAGMERVELLSVSAATFYVLGAVIYVAGASLEIAIRDLLSERTVLLVGLLPLALVLLYFRAVDRFEVSLAVGLAYVWAAYLHYAYLQFAS